MKIAVWHNLPSGGGKRALHDHVRGLVARGHQVECWCPPSADLDYMPLEPYCAEHVVPYAAGDPRIRGRWRRMTAPYWETIADLDALEEHSRRCAEAINRGGFNVLLANSCMFQGAPMIGRYISIPALLYLQEPFRNRYEAYEHPDGTRLGWIGAPPEPSAQRPVPWNAIDRLLSYKGQLKGLVWEMSKVESLRARARSEVAGARAYRVILCNSLFSRESILRSYGIESRVCYLGIDVSAFPPCEEKHPYVVGLGSIGPVKGIEPAIRALATIEPIHRPPLVWIANRTVPEYFDHMRALAASLGVQFEPKILISQEELVSLLGKAAVMIYAPRLEPFGYAPLEANACGTWVVAVAEGGVRESITDDENGSLIDWGDWKTVGRAVLRYTSDLELAQTAGAKARRFVQEKWGLESSIDRLEERLLEFCGMPHSLARAATR
jgi:glycosyltransferase involved in cell wall biosynthesis